MKVELVRTPGDEARQNQQILEAVAKGCERWKGRHAAEDILERIGSSLACFRLVSPERTLGFLLGRVDRGRHGNTFVIWMLHLDRSKAEERRALRDSVFEWAAQQGCRWVEAVGRSAAYGRLFQTDDEPAYDVVGFLVEIGGNGVH